MYVYNNFFLFLQMDKSEIYALILLLDKIEKKQIETRDDTERRCLRSDEEKVKLALAQRIFDLPLDTPIFGDGPNVTIDPLNSSQELKTTDLSLTMEKLDSTEEDGPNFDFSEEENPRKNISPTDELQPDFTFEPSFEESPIRPKKSMITINKTNQKEENNDTETDSLAAKFENFLRSKGGIGIQQPIIDENKEPNKRETKETNVKQKSKLPVRAPKKN